MTLELVDTSSRPFDPQAILRTLVDGEVDFVVIGGIAALAHGYDRGTADVDTTARASTENLDRLVAALSLMDARLLVPVNAEQEATVDVPIDTQTFVALTSARFLTRFGVLDVVLRPDGVPSYEEWLASATDVELPGGGRIRVAALELIITSKAAGRPKDLEALPRLRALQRLRDGRPD